MTLAYLVVFLPFAGAALAPPLYRLLKERVGWWAALIAFSLFVYLMTFTPKAVEPISLSSPWPPHGASSSPC